MREIPPSTCRVARPSAVRGDGTGLAAAGDQRLRPGAVALDPLMHPAGPCEPHAGATCLQEPPPSHTTWPGSELRLEPGTVTVGQLVGHAVGVREDRRGQHFGSQVVRCRSPIALPLDLGSRYGKQPLDPRRQLLCCQTEHLQLPAARCYLLLDRPRPFRERRDRKGVEPPPEGSPRTSSSLRPCSPSAEEIFDLERLLPPPEVEPFGPLLEGAWRRSPPTGDAGTCTWRLSGSIRGQSG